MRNVIASAAMVVAVLFGAAPADARVLISVDKSSQRMSVSVNGIPRYNWDVSTGRANFSTPVGVFSPQRLERSWFSTKYYNSPMPHSIFFYRGYAIHGSSEISRLGGPASHGCIRLHPSNAAALYDLVQREGPGATTIVVSGENGYGVGAPEARYGVPRDEFGRAPRYQSRGDLGRPRYVPYDDGGWTGWGYPVRR